MSIPHVPTPPECKESEGKRKGRAEERKCGYCTSMRWAHAASSIDRSAVNPSMVSSHPIPLAPRRCAASAAS